MESQTIPTTEPRRRLCHVLVEAPTRWNWAVAEASRLSDCTVTFCAGPAAQPGGTCPMAVEGSCDLINEADVLVTHLDWSVEANRAALAAVRHERPRLPVIVLAWQADIDAHGDLFGGCHVVRFPWTLPKLQAAMTATRESTAAAATA